MFDIITHRCSRPGCGSVGCTVFVPSIGYICSSCQDEALKASENWSKNIPEREVKDRLVAFMKTRKNTSKSDPVCVLRHLFKRP
jgi:hypothetical protein